MEEASSPLSPVEEFFVGGAAAARSLALLRAFKIAHVINVAQEEPNSFPGQLRYLRVGLPNGPRVCQQLMEALDQTERFIAEAKESKVFRRSCSLCLRFLTVLSSPLCLYLLFSR